MLKKRLKLGSMAPNRRVEAMLHNMRLWDNSSTYQPIQQGLVVALLPQRKWKTTEWKTQFGAETEGEI